MAEVTDADALVWETMQSHLQAMGYFENVDIGEPKAPPSPTAGAIIPISGRVDETVLDAPRFISVVSVRSYGEGIGENREKVERELSQIRTNIVADVFGDFTMGGNIAYALPRLLDWRWGWVTIGGTLFRLLDINIAYRVDVSYQFAP